MTVQDLLRHTSGLTTRLFGRSMVKDLYVKAKVTEKLINLTRQVWQQHDASRCYAGV
jgi:hypothetical protein